VAFRLQVVPGHDPPDLLDLPWTTPLCQWDHPRLIRMAQGVSRHVVRIVSDRERAYALKETSENDARREYAMLRSIAAENLPVVEAVGLVTGRRTPSGDPLDAVLITRYLDFSLPYRYLFGVEGGPYLGKRLVDAAVVLLVRLHSEGFYWGDCSLSNLLFRRDAGALMAYLVDAETTEHRVPLAKGMREADLDLARENFAGGLLDLVAEGQLAGDVDVIELADMVAERYHVLWEELTATLELDMADRHLIDQRLRRLNGLGFDVGELIVEHEGDGSGGDHARLRVTPALVEEGHHSRELRRLTGLEVQENQARRLLNDIAAFGAYLSRVEDRTFPQAVVAARWIADVYERVVESVPPELRGRLEPPELFHELLEHRYYLSEQAGHEVTNEVALASYLQSVLRFRREERVLLAEQGGAPAP
jgi:hypothetical protein